METRVGGLWKKAKTLQTKRQEKLNCREWGSGKLFACAKISALVSNAKSVKFAFSWLLNSSNWDGDILGGDGFSTAANFTTFNSLINNFNTFEGNWKFLTHATAPVSLVNRRLVNLLTILMFSTLCGSARFFQEFSKITIECWRFKRVSSFVVSNK